MLLYRAPLKRQIVPDEGPRLHTGEELRGILDLKVTGKSGKARKSPIHPVAVGVVTD